MQAEPPKDALTRGGGRVRCATWPRAGRMLRGRRCMAAWAADGVRPEREVHTLAREARARVWRQDLRRAMARRPVRISARQHSPRWHVLHGNQGFTGCLVAPTRASCTKPHARCRPVDPLRRSSSPEYSRLRTEFSRTPSAPTMPPAKASSAGTGPQAHMPCSQGSPRLLLGAPSLPPWLHVHPAALSASVIERLNPCLTIRLSKDASLRVV